MNSSRSAMGFSAGIRGVRVSIGPRGTYVTFGVGGFSYLHKVDDSPACHVAQVAPGAFVHDAEVRARRANLFKVYRWFAIILVLIALASSAAAFVALLVVALVFGFFVRKWDIERRTTRIFYDVDRDEIVERLALCNAAGEALARSARLWHLFSPTTVWDKKYHAGASTVVQRLPTRCVHDALDGIELNVDTWSMGVGPLQILFLPDCLLVRQGKKYACASYESLVVKHGLTRFIEDGHVPPDAQVIDSSWQFVNKSGGPDLRFNNNRQLPVVMYGELTLRSPTGFEVVLQSSNSAAAQQAAAALVELARIARGAWPVVSPAMPPVSAVQRMELRAPTPPPSTALTEPRRFVGVNETLFVAGRTIARPLTYVSSSTAGADASTIITSLPVGDASRAAPLPYWPSYAEADPDQRARYLDWMARGRVDREIEIGYVFIFFYGLEWRALREGVDVDVAVEQVEQLLEFHGRQSVSFRGYASAFITFAAVRAFNAIDESSLERMLGKLANDSQSAMAFVLAWYAERRRPLPARYACAAVAAMDDAKGGVVVQRSRKELEDLFSTRYREKFADGIVLETAKRPLVVDYRAASATWWRAGHKLSVSIPNVLGRRAQFKPLVGIWNQCIDELRRASALKGKNAGILTAQAWAALPPELRAQYDHPDRDRWDTAVATSPRLANSHLVKVASLAKLVGVVANEKVTAAELRKVAETAADLGYAVEPDARVLRSGARTGDEVLVWRTQDTTCPDPMLYASVYTMTTLAMVVAMADGVLQDEEVRVVSSMLGTMFALDEGMQRRLAALVQLLARQPARAAALTKKLRTTRSRDDLAKVGRVLVAVAAADGVIAEEERKALRGLYKALGLSVSDLDAAIACSGARLASDDVVEIRPAAPSTAGEKIPPLATNGDSVAIDHAAVEAILADTRDVAAILAGVLDGDEDDEPMSAVISVPAPTAAPAASARIVTMAARLDVRYHAVLEDLLGKATWSKDEIRALATRRNLMPGAILETINAWSDETFGDFLIDDAEEEWHIRADLLKKQSA
ncbi:MAG: TerB N-terminal domain-containing protein [Polyangiaceae bacterium]|nr:TerB N-terminal domain-containing protein [Polyangiaceae bacterium]